MLQQEEQDKAEETEDEEAGALHTNFCCLSQA